MENQTSIDEMLDKARGVVVKSYAEFLINNAPSSTASPHEVMEFVQAAKEFKNLLESGL